MTPEEAIDTLWRIASNAVLVAADGRPAQGLTYADYLVLTTARDALLRTVQQWRSTLGDNDAERA